MSPSVERSIQRPNRRSFLKAASSLAGAPWIVPSSVFGANAPSNRINVGCIGIGNQGIGILKRFLNNDDVQVIFRFIQDYSGEQITNFGAHANDLAQWGLGMDKSGPVEVEYVSAQWHPEGGLFNTPIALEVRYRYANGVELTCKSSKEKMVGVRFEGTEGWIEASAYGWRAESDPASLIAKDFPEGKLSFDATTAHVRNFLDCVKSREEPAATGEIGHRSATVCHLGNIAVCLGRTVKWDPVNETFSGDVEANQMLNRPMRSPWQL